MKTGIVKMFKVVHYSPTGVRTVAPGTYKHRKSANRAGRNWANTTEGNLYSFSVFTEEELANMRLNA